MTLLHIVNFLVGMFCLYFSAQIFEDNPYQALFGVFFAGGNFYCAFFL